MNKKAKQLLRQKKELIILMTSMYHLTLFLEKAGAIENGKLKEDCDKSFEDIKGAISLGQQIMTILQRVSASLQNGLLPIANDLLKKADNQELGFNYLTFTLTLLMEYKESFKNKVYALPISYGELNDIYDAYFVIGLKDKEQMSIITDSMKLASDFYKEVLNYE